ncbi:uncharacterized protein LOC143605284 [Bidens hawaiensis]|uniref:uncharacterized protein LOC143605284 n=1 Tax=Bidens hawaiensis TaxID=980011 RepID=UPI00404AC97A
MAGNSIDVNNKRVSANFLQIIATLLILFGKHAMIVSKTLKNKSRVPTRTPKKLISSISNKAMKLCQRKNTGEDGVWRKEILMGDKCEPLDFSGVIYYDKDGNILSECPMRSPRASPLPGFASTPVMFQEF